MSPKSYFSPGSAGSAGYVLVVMALMAIATADPNHPRLGFFLGSLFLCLPTMVPGLPVFYLTIAAMWGLTSADRGGATWPLTMAYVGMIGLVAASNVLVIRRNVRRRRQIA